MTSIGVRIYDPAGNLLDIVNDRIDPWYREELLSGPDKGVGGGRFRLHVDSAALARTPGLLARGNLVRFFLGGFTGAWRIEKDAHPIVKAGERAELVYEVSGRGLLSLFERAAVWMSGGFRPTAGDERRFDFASLDDGPLDMASWAEPMFSPWGSGDVGVRKGSPKDWPDPQGQWMWPGPAGPTNLNMPEQDGYFRRKFTTATAARYRFFCTGDNSFELYVNEDQVLTGADWGTSFSVDVWVPAGDTIVAIKGHNWPQVPGFTSTAGVLFAMYAINGDGSLGAIQRRSAPGAGWLAKLDTGTPPGWNMGQAVSTVLAEAKARGVTAVQPLNPTWSAGTDSDGVAWSKLIDRTFSPGDSQLNMVTQLAETNGDIRVRGSDFGVEIREHQGRDLTADPGAVVLWPGGNVVDGDYDSDDSACRDTLLIRTSDGWMQVQAPGATGRSEGGLEVGNASSDAQVQRVADYTFAQYGDQVEKVTCTLDETGPVPFVDFTVGDTVLALGGDNMRAPHRVLAIEAYEKDGHVLYTVELQPS